MNKKDARQRKLRDGQLARIATRRFGLGDRFVLGDFGMISTIYAIYATGKRL